MSRKGLSIIIVGLAVFLNVVWLGEAFGARSLTIGQPPKTITNNVNWVTCLTPAAGAQLMTCRLFYTGSRETYTEVDVENKHTPEMQATIIEHKLDNAGLWGEQTDGGEGNTESSGAGNCDLALLPDSWCGEDGVWNVLQLVLDIMTAGVGILATIGLVISGMQWMTARDKEDQIVKAKSRIFNIVIGVVVWALMWLVLTWLIPGFTLGT